MYPLLWWVKATNFEGIADLVSGVYLTDLTFIEDGIPSIIKKTNLINMAKRSKTAEVIRDIQQYQAVGYSLQPVPELQDYILSNMQAAGDVHEMYDKSLQVEPREREDEKIVRYVVVVVISMLPYRNGLQMAADPVLQSPCGVRIPLDWSAQRSYIRQ